MEDKTKEECFQALMRGDVKGLIDLFDYLYYPLLYFTKQLLSNQKPRKKTVYNYFIERWIKNDRKYIRDTIYNSFIEMWSKKNEINFKQPGQIKNWLYENVSDKISKLNKSVNEEPVLPSEFMHAIIKAEIFHDVNNTVNLLPNLQRKVYISFFYGENEVQRIANELKISASQVKSEIEKAVSFVEARSVFKFQLTFKFNETN